MSTGDRPIEPADVAPSVAKQSASPSAVERFFAIASLRDMMYGKLKNRELAKLRTVNKTVCDEVSRICFHSVTLTDFRGVWNVSLMHLHAPCLLILG